MQADLDLSTKEKIKAAARTVFLQKGFSATRTRDIADASGINLALINYHFRSKEKLFDLIMLEIVQSFALSLKTIFNDEQTTLETKIEQMVHQYIDLLTEHPDIPLFILSELRLKPNELVNKLGVKDVIMQSFFMHQFQQVIKEQKIKPIHPIHFIMNLMGLTVFPFIAAPIIQNLSDTSKDEYATLIQQRKLLVPNWIKAILNDKQ
jgi:AcrR family transcriptional regulator